MTIDKLFRYIHVLMLVAFIFSLAFTPIRVSNDVWWHLKTGKYIVEHNYQIPRYDIFAYTSENIKWYNHEWLTEIIFYWIYCLGEDSGWGGLRSVITFKCVILMIAAFFVFLTVYLRTKNFYVSLLFTAMAAAVARRSIYPRPPVITFMIFAAFLYLLYLYKEGKVGARTLFIVFPLVMIFWANLHGGFVLGLILVGFFLIGELVEYFYLRWIKKTGNEKEKLKRVYIVGLLLGLCLVASLLNPFGYKVHLLTFKVMGKPGLVRIIPELHPPDFFFTWVYELLIVFLLLGFAILGRRIPYVFDFLIVGFFLHQSIHHVRHLPLFGIIAAPLCGWIATRLIDQIPQSLQRYSSHLASFLFFILCIRLIFSFETGKSYMERNWELLKGTEYIRENYPAEACDFIIANRFTGRMYNQINYAGYLIWRLSPEHHKVFTDPRYDIFADQFVWDEKTIEKGLDRHEPGYNWYDLVDKYKINFMLITRGAELNEKLYFGNDWKLVYYWIDPRSVSSRSGFNIFVRNIPENQELIARCLQLFDLIKQQRQNEQS